MLPTLELIARHGLWTVAAGSILPLCPPPSRINTFIVQQQKEAPNMDDVLISFSRMSESDFHTLLDKLQGIPGVQKLDAKGLSARRTY